MSKTSENRPKQHICIGVLAHVDAGKTTLSEAMLYLAGAIRKLGRVDHKTAFLDTDRVEQDRGITVFSKEARFLWNDKNFTLLDTPGHADFSAEAERTLQVLDYALLIISGADGVQGHTATLWKLLQAYGIPTFVFVNKMDRPDTDRLSIMENLNEHLGGGFVRFENAQAVDFEEVAMCSESLMEEYLGTGTVEAESITNAIRIREMFPVCFGSALKVEGVEYLLNTIEKYTEAPQYPSEFGARVYKITRDKQGVRQTHMKITGGSLKSKMLISDADWQEKAEQIRLFSGRTFETAAEVKAGSVCAVTGLSRTYAGEGLGSERLSKQVHTMIEPALNYKMILPQGTDPATAIQKLRQLAEEDPSLNITWKEQLKEIHVSVMGRLELEILQNIIKERFDLDVSFGEGSVIYKETIASPVIGIGHFEPLKHYAEVHLLLEPLPRGSGIVYDTMVSEDKLDKNWQRLIMTHLKEREHVGILTGSPITDVRISIIAGKAHVKHTEGGDFRQATYRAVRQGLGKARNILLEPVCKFKIRVPNENVGRVLSDMQRFGGKCDMPQLCGNDSSLIEGTAPSVSVQDYQQEIAAYTKGKGQITLSFAGYDECHNPEEVIASAGYDWERDLENPAGSVFCKQGGAIYVSWDEVDEYADVESGYKLTEEGSLRRDEPVFAQAEKKSPVTAGAKELEEIFLRTYGKSKRDEAIRREQLSRGSRKPARPETMSGSFPQLKKSPNFRGETYFVVDGYNVIFAWKELSDLASINIDSAREMLIEILENYAAYKKIGMAVVFDGYKVSGNPGTSHSYGELKVVYTREAQTADRFIEETVYSMSGKFNVTVVTSDRPVQMAALGDGASRMSARDFYTEVSGTSDEIRRLLKSQKKTFNRPFEKALEGKEFSVKEKNNKE